MKLLSNLLRRIKKGSSISEREDCSSVNNDSEELARSTIEAVEQAYAKSPRGEPWKRFLSRIDSLSSDTLANIMDCVEDAEISEVVNRIRQRRSLLETDTNITDQIVGISKQVLAFGAGFLTIGLVLSDKALSLPILPRRILFLGGAFYLQLVFVAVFVLIMYTLQARFRYPFLSMPKIGNAWPFFYYAAISPGTPRTEIQTHGARKLGGARYAEDLLRFSSNVVSETERDMLRNELQQYFVLMAYQAYNNQFSLRLTNAFIYLIVGATVSTVLLSILVLFVL